MNSKTALLKRVPAMIEGGVALGKIKKQLQEFVKPGVTFSQVEELAQKLIARAGMKPSFSEASCKTSCSRFPRSDPCKKRWDILF